MNDMTQKHFYMFPLLLLAVAFSTDALAQSYDWLDGKWLAAGEMFDIKGNSINKVVGGATISMGEFTIDEENLIRIDDEPIGLVAFPDNQYLTYLTNPDFHFRKYESLSLDSKYAWVVGSWTNGSDVISFTEKDITVRQGDYVVDRGMYYIDEQGFVNVYWENDKFQDGLLVTLNAVAYEGGDSLSKLPENFDAKNSDILSALTESLKPYEGDIKWVYGLWKLPDSNAEIYITPKYFQARGANDSYLDGLVITDLEEVPYTVLEGENKILGTIVKLGDYYLDTSSKLLYSLSGLDKKTYLEKAEKYVSPVIKYGKWILLVLVGITAIVFLIIFLVRLIKKVIVAFKKWRQKTKENLAIKAQDAKEKAIELKDKAKERAADISEKAKEKAVVFGGKAKEMVSSVSERAIDKVKELSEQARNSTQNVAQGMEEVEAEGMESMSSPKPWGSILSALFGFSKGGDTNDNTRVKKWMIIAAALLSVFLLSKWCSSSSDDYSSETKTEKSSGAWSGKRKCEYCGKMYSATDTYRSPENGKVYTACSNCCAQCYAKHSIESDRKWLREQIKEGRNKWVDDHPNEARRRGIEKF